DLALPVAVLQALAHERRSSRRRAEQEAAATLVPEAPDEVAHALEAEHRIEDEERDHRLAPGGVAWPGRRRRRHRARFGDALFEDPPFLRFAIAEEEPGVDRLVLLPQRRVDLDVPEQGVEPERARLVGDDRDDALSPLRFVEQLAEQPGE